MAKNKAFAEALAKNSKKVTKVVKNFFNKHFDINEGVEKVSSLAKKTATDIADGTNFPTIKPSQIQEVVEKAGSKLEKNIIEVADDVINPRVNQAMGMVNDALDDPQKFERIITTFRKKGYITQDQSFDMSTESLKTLKGFVNTKESEKVYNALLNDQVVNLSTTIGYDEALTMYNKAFNKDGTINLLSAKAAHKAMIRKQVAANQVAFKNLSTQYDMDMFKLVTYTLKDKIDFAHRIAEKEGLQNASYAIEKFYKDFNKIQALDNQVRTLRNNIRKDIEGVPEDAQRMTRSYIDSIRKEKISQEKIDIGNGVTELVEIDKEAMAFVSKAYGKDMSIDDIKRANKLININRWLKLKHQEMEGTAIRATKPNIKMKLEGGDPSMSKIKNAKYDIGYDYSIIPQNEIIYKDAITSRTLGDYGINWTPIRYTDEFVSNARAAKGFDDILASGKGGRDTEFSFNKVRSEFLENKSFAERDAIRKPFYEEMDQYLSEFSNVTIKQNGLDGLRRVNAAFSVYDVLGKYGKMEELNTVQKNFRPVMQDIMSHYNAAFNSAGKPEHLLTQTLAFTTDLATASALTSPRLILTNLFLQPFSNSAMWHGFGNVLNGFKENLPYSGTVFKSAFSGKGFSDVIGQMRKKNLSKFQVSALEDYFRVAKPDVLQSDMIATSNAARTLMNFSTLPFQYTDIMTRMVSLSAAAKQAERVYSKYQNDLIKKSSKSPKAINNLIKELHLDGFRGLDAKDLLNQAHNKRKFISTYSKISVDREIYDYSRLNRPEFLDHLKKHPLGSRAARFMTWPLYYKNIASGALNSWKAGDKKPMLSMLGFSAAWFSAMSTIDGFDVPILDGMARYGIAKTPLISPLTSIYDMADRSIGGIVMPQLALVAWPFFEIMDKTSKLLGAEDNAFTWGAEEAQQKMLASPLVNYPFLKDVINELF